MRRFRSLVALAVLSGAGCVTTPDTAPDVAVTVASQPVGSDTECTGGFIAHRLDHMTEVAAERVGFYASNGSGLAAGDLDRDGDLDLVLANLDGHNAILWNEQAMRFRKSLRHIW